MPLSIPHSQPPADAPIANVLLVDDHPPNLLALEAVLAPLGVRLVRAGSGTQALECLLREDFAVIVLDVQMPVLDGFETAALIRLRERTREVPILFVTAIHRDDAHQARGYAHGAVDYLTKPFNPDVLRAKVAALVALWQRGETLRRREARLHQGEKAAQQARVKALAGDLLESESRLRRVLEASGAGLWDLDAATEGIEADPRMLELLGLPAGTTLDIAKLLAATHESDRAGLAGAVRAALTAPAGGRFAVEFRTRGAAGAPERWMEGRGQVFADERGRRTHLAGALLDVTARKRAEAAREDLLDALGQSEERYRLATQATKDAIWDWDLRTGEVAWGEGVCELFAYAGDEVGRGSDWWYATIHPDDRARVTRGIDAVRDAAGRSEWHDEYRFRRRDGTYARVANRGWVARDAAGQALRIVGAMQDVTEARAADEERRRLLEREQRARAEAEEANELKDQFLATVSHELRTPLTAMLGWVQLLRAGTLAPEKHARALATVERNARAQAQIIEDLLDVSRILAGKLRLDLELVPLRSVIDAAVDTVRPAADAKSVRLEVPVDIDAVVTGDPQRLQQVLWNLLSNGVKFTPEGGCVEVRVEPGESVVEVSVTDSGRGIAPDFLGHVFERFRQADGTTTRASGGLGLGLSIVRQIVELHGGEVSVASDGEGRGARFTVSLPRSAVRPSDAALLAPRALEASHALSRSTTLDGVRVLVVDDQEDIRDMLRTVLEEGGARVTVASSAAEALRLLTAERHSLLVADIGMPGEDGYALVERVRALPPAAGGAIPALALTAYARGDDRDRALSAGFSFHLAKPVDPVELLAVVARLSGAAREAHADPADPGGQGKRSDGHDA